MTPLVLRSLNQKITFVWFNRISCDRDNIDNKGKYNGIPDLVIEVMSPSTRGKDLIKKLDLYKQCAVKEYWVVDPMNDSITVYSLAEDDILDMKIYQKTGNHIVVSAHFEGLKIALKDIFV